jgi:hypothetical protein
LTGNIVVEGWLILINAIDLWNNIVTNKFVDIIFANIINQRAFNDFRYNNKAHKKEEWGCKNLNFQEALASKSSKDLNNLIFARVPLALGKRLGLTCVH